MRQISQVIRRDFYANGWTCIINNHSNEGPGKLCIINDKKNSSAREKGCLQQTSSLKWALATIQECRAIRYETGVKSNLLPQLSKLDIMLILPIIKYITQLRLKKMCK